MINFDHRRTALRAIVALGAASALTFRTPWAHADAPLRIDADRLRRNLEGLSRFGRPPGGAFDDGVSRVAYSEADLAGRAFCMGLIRDAGGEPIVDAAGNIVARRPGREAGLKPIAIGSHVDSVPGGGNFDGALGSLAAIEVLQTLTDRKVLLRHPLEVVLWSNEEGGTIGSGFAVGATPPSALGLTLNGIKRSDGLRKIGGDPARLAEARRAPGSLEAYLELHIEQSGLLEKAGVPIGVVDGIVAIDEFEVEIRGVANHAGATPMADRKNALLAAAQLIEAVQEEVTRDPGRQVGGVGHLEVFPNARNVVPGLVRHTIELRDIDPAKLDAISGRIAQRAGKIADQTQTQVDIKRVARDAPALATAFLQHDIEQAATDLGLTWMHLQSGAGHDAAMIAKIAPMAMIFVPSKGGVSHSPHEFTAWSDCANGANVLLTAVMRLDRA